MATNRQVKPSHAMFRLSSFVQKIKREISIMKLVRHPNVVCLHEILHGLLSEAESRRYFQQLIDGVDYCHSKGVFHRDLKPENLLLDSQGNLKISDFGLSAMPEQGVTLRTTCGTPNYVAPEVLSHKGYNGAVADVWSCGVILYVLMAGYLPFDELDLTTLYSYKTLELKLIRLIRTVERAEYTCPSWFPVGAKSLIHRILDPNPETRITIEEIRNDEWFRKGYIPTGLLEYEDVNLDDINAAFDDPEEEQSTEQYGNEDTGPLLLNAFDLIILSQGLNLASLFDRGTVLLLSMSTMVPLGQFGLLPLICDTAVQMSVLLLDSVKHQTRFVSQKPAKVVLSSMEVVAQSMGFKTHIRNYKMRVEGLSASKSAHFSVILEIFEVAPTFFMVDVQKAAGDSGEFLKVNGFHTEELIIECLHFESTTMQFYKNFCSIHLITIAESTGEAGSDRSYIYLYTID
ncbi:NAF domain [Dillenia turbinata]|uniref:non-specific serine/threonine protein kinase n=1 Tax=Dillenia turbinata TaxID=194707 RepID=A0AAN8W223_9MAGN